MAELAGNVRLLLRSRHDVVGHRILDLYEDVVINVSHGQLVLTLGDYPRPGDERDPSVMRREADAARALADLLIRAAAVVEAEAGTLERRQV